MRCVYHLEPPFFFFFCLDACGFCLRGPASWVPPDAGVALGEPMSVPLLLGDAAWREASLEGWEIKS